MAFVLAAGRGHRLRPLTDHLPKPLARLRGRRLVEHRLLGLAAAGVTRAVVNTGWLGEKIPAALGHSAFGISLDYSPEGWPALETGGGILKALPRLDGRPFLLANGDVFTEGFDWQPLIDIAHRLAEPGDGRLAHLVLVPNPEYHAEGDFVLDATSGRLLPESTFLPRYTYAGLAVLHPALFDPPPYPVGTAFGLAGLLRRAIVDGRVSGELFTGLWTDVGTPDRLCALGGDPEQRDDGLVAVPAFAGGLA